jgi:hypothetical protein
MSLGAYVKVPTSLVEHLWLLTPAETALCLVVLRRGSRNGAFVPVTISESNWAKWTGLSGRQRDYAIAGLRDKGLTMQGRGDKALFSFDLNAFKSFAASAVPAKAQARTKGRAKGVPVPAGTIVHEDCRKNGCQMLCGSEEQSCTPLVRMPPRSVPTLVAVPVADIARSVGGESRAEFERDRMGQSGDTATLVSAPRGKRVDYGLLFPDTLALLRSVWPLVGSDFMARLVGNCLLSVEREQLTDDVLSRAVKFAHEARSHNQKSEGLFLVTVPPFVKRLVAAVVPIRAYSCSVCWDEKTTIVEDGRDEFGAILSKVPCSSCCGGGSAALVASNCSS